MRHQHRFGIAPEIGPGHGDDVDLVAPDELAEMLAKPVIRVCGNVVELIDGNQPVVESTDAVLVHGEPERGVGENKHLVIAFEERPDRLDLRTERSPEGKEVISTFRNGWSPEHD